MQRIIVHAQLPLPILVHLIAEERYLKKNIVNGARFNQYPRFSTSAATLPLKVDCVLQLLK